MMIMIIIIIIIMHGRQWETSVEAYHFVPINSPPAPFGLYRPAQSLCQYAGIFVWTTGSVTEVKESVSDP
jgi:hypothetical protein